MNLVMKTSLVDIFTVRHYYFSVLLAPAALDLNLSFHCVFRQGHII